MAQNFRDTGNSAPTQYGYKGGGSSTTPDHPDTPIAPCNLPPRIPTMQTIGLPQGQYMNKLINFAQPVTRIWINYNIGGDGDIAAFFHFTPFPDGTPFDQDDLQTQQLPAIFVGHPCLAQYDVPVTTRQSSFFPTGARQPYIVLCHPTDQMYFSGWAEASDGSIVDQGFTIYASNDFDEVYAYLQGGN